MAAAACCPRIGAERVVVAQGTCLRMGADTTLAQAAVRPGSQLPAAATGKSAAPAQRVGNGNLALLLHLEELARDPRRAHLEWRRLDTAQRLSLAERMRRHFG